MQQRISFVLDGALRQVEFGSGSEISPTTTVLQYLRSLPSHKGVKEGCAEGDCGACTVVIGEPGDDDRLVYRAVNSCLVFLPMLHGKHLMTVENLKGPDGSLDPVQAAMVHHDASQCGFCTPGIVMSLVGLARGRHRPERADVMDALSGNLCRCTGYRPIVDAALEAFGAVSSDGRSGEEARITQLLKSIPSESVYLEAGGQHYTRPASFGEAITLLHRSPEAIIIGGATDVALRVTKNHERLAGIIDLSGIRELNGINDDGKEIRIGSGTVLNDVLRSVGDRFPALHDALSLFGSHQIRNVATLGGNLGTASPIGDTLPVLMAYGARVALESLNGTREVLLEEFITGYRKTLRKRDELIRSIILPLPENGTLVKSYKVSRRRDVDIAAVNAGFRLDRGPDGIVRSVFLAYGGMALQVKRAIAAERYLTGRRWDRRAVEAAMPLVSAEFSPITDVRGSTEMRLALARNLLLKFWLETQGVQP